MHDGEFQKQDQNASKRRHVLVLVNWTVTYSTEKPEGLQPPDYFIPGESYWFFRYMSPEWDVDVVDITAPRFIARVEKKIRFYIWQTLRILPRVRKYDLVISHGMQSGIVLALWRRLFGKGIYKHIVFDIGAFNSGRESGRSLKLMQFASKSLDGVIYHTEIQKDYYQKCHPWLVNKSRFIPFGTDTEYFMPDESGCENDTSTYMISFGKIKRDWRTLLRAYALSNKTFKLRIVGVDASDLGDSETEDEIPDKNVEVYPTVSLVRLQEMIRGAVFCVVPLDRFPYSYGQMTLLQQMAMGKAVIAADVPSLQAYHDGGGVLWYESGNEEQLAEKIDLLSNDAELRKSLCQRARSAIVTLYNEKLMAERIDHFLHERMEWK